MGTIHLAKGVTLAQAMGQTKGGKTAVAPVVAKDLELVHQADHKMISNQAILNKPASMLDLHAAVAKAKAALGQVGLEGKMDTALHDALLKAPDQASFQAITNDPQVRAQNGPELRESLQIMAKAPQSPDQAAWINEALSSL